MAHVLPNTLAPADGNITIDNLVTIDSAATLPIVFDENRLQVPQ